MLPPSTLPARRLRRTLSPLIKEAARQSRADRYRKSFPAHAHVWMLLLHTMNGNTSLRQSYAQQQADPVLHRFLGMEGWISYSQLARSSTSRPAGCFERLLASLLRLARDRRGRRVPEILRGVRLLDSTFFPLGAKASPWGAWNKRGNSGARLQAILDPSERLPTGLKLDLLNTNDANALGGLDLSGLGGRTLVFDLGYYSHAHFGRLLGGGVHFLTRLKGQARYRVTASRALPEGSTTPEGDSVLSDEAIDLGSPNNRRGAAPCWRASGSSGARTRRGRSTGS